MDFVRQFFIEGQNADEEIYLYRRRSEMLIENRIKELSTRTDLILSKKGKDEKIKGAAKKAAQEIRRSFQ